MNLQLFPGWTSAVIFRKVIHINNYTIDTLSLRARCMIVVLVSVETDISRLQGWPMGDVGLQGKDSIIKASHSTSSHLHTHTNTTTQELLLCVTNSHKGVKDRPIELWIGRSKLLVNKYFDL